MRIIQGEARGRKLFEPRGASARPPLDRIRESVFSVLGAVFEGGGVLDLFAGVGSFGLEALSRGARRAVFVDSAPASLAVLEKNITTLGFWPRSTVLRGDALSIPDLSGRPEREFAVAFIDPPFKMFDDPAEADRVFARAREVLSSRTILPEGRVVLRHPSRFRADPPIPPQDRREYGESTVLFFAPG
jgi:16S rRNA (guanine(966)-N(2))-methyltransferase RsmD